MRVTPADSYPEELTPVQSVQTKVATSVTLDEVSEARML